MTNKAILLCLAIGLAAFSTGILVGKFRLPAIQEETRIERKPTDVSVYVNSDEINLREIKFVCNDDKLRPIWRDLLPEISRELFTARLQASYDCIDLLKVQEIDLNSDGKNEVLVTVQAVGVCGAHGNCPFAIYRRIDEQFRTSAGVFYFEMRRMLYRGGAVSYTLERKTNDGFPNIVLRENGGSYEDYLHEYEYDNRYYRFAKCYGENKKTLVRFEGCD